MIENKTLRNYGIDFLRIISMFMVVVLHVLGWGVLKNAIPLSSHYWCAYFMEIFAYCAVDCFALISGYVMWNSQYRISKMIMLWLQVVFYTIIITAISFVFFKDTISVGNIINAFFPVTTKQYWYISAYFGMYLFIPLLNTCIQNCEKKVLRAQLFLMFFFFCVLTTIFGEDPYVFSGGYSTIWLCVLYLAGGYICKYDAFGIIKSSHSFGLFVATSSLTFMSKVMMEYMTKIVLGEPKFGNIFVNYKSPLVVLSAIFLLVTFSKIQFGTKMKRLIGFFAPTSLGVYIIHIHPLVKTKLPVGFACEFLRFNPVVTMMLVLISSFVIWLLCSLVEKGRLNIFRKLYVEKKINTAIDKILAKVNR